MTEQATSTSPRYGQRAWEIEAYERDTYEDPHWRTRTATGFGQGRCACGYDTDDQGNPIRMSEIPGKLLAHIREEHPDWPADVCDGLTRTWRTSHDRRMG